VPRGDHERLGRLTRQRRGGGRRDHRLTTVRDELGKGSPAVAVELGEHVVEQHEGRRPAALADDRCLSEDERQDGDPLLTL
jgi:hypothetical protein